MSNSLQPHGLQHARLPCLSPTPRVCSNSYSLSQWYHPAILSSVIPFSSASNLSQHQGLFQWVSSLYQVARVLELQLQHQSFQSILMVDLLAVWRTLKRFLQYHISKASICWHSAFFMVQLSHPYVTTGENIALTVQTFVGKVMSLLFNMLCQFVIAFLPRSKCLLISWLQFPSAVILEPTKIKSVAVSTVSPTICHEGWGWMSWS